MVRGARPALLERGPYGSVGRAQTGNSMGTWAAVRYRWFTTPDLIVAEGDNEDRVVSVCDWLRTGRDP